MRKTRPCLVISSDFINRRRRTVVIVPLSTTSPKQFPLYVPLPSISADSQAVVDQIRVIDKGRAGDWIGSASVAEMQNLAQAMKLAFEIG
jgi:mRNA interferase MazF